jgi:hypothetical protein
MTTTRAVKLSTGFEIPLDGDLLAIIEGLYKEITLGTELNTSFETMRNEVLSVIDQMSDDERRSYLAESLFLNSVTYENEMLSAYVRRLGTATPAKATAKPAPTRKAALKQRSVKKASPARAKAKTNAKAETTKRRSAR